MSLGGLSFLEKGPSLLPPVRPANEDQGEFPLVDLARAGGLWRALALAYDPHPVERDYLSDQLNIDPVALPYAAAIARNLLWVSGFSLQERWQVQTVHFSVAELALSRRGEEQGGRGRYIRPLLDIRGADSVSVNGARAGSPEETMTTAQLSLSLPGRATYYRSFLDGFPERVQLELMLWSAEQILQHDAKVGIDEPTNPLRKLVDGWRLFIDSPKVAKDPLWRTLIRVGEGEDLIGQLPWSIDLGTSSIRNSAPYAASLARHLRGKLRWVALFKRSINERITGRMGAMRFYHTPIFHFVWGAAPRRDMYRVARQHRELGWSSIPPLWASEVERRWLQVLSKLEELTVSYVTTQLQHLSAGASDSGET